jgi:hypothetical protein
VAHVVGPSVNNTIAPNGKELIINLNCQKIKLKNEIISSEKNDSKFNISKHLLSPKIMKSLPSNLTCHQNKSKAFQTNNTHCVCPNFSKTFNCK